MTLFGPELNGKRLERLKAAAPQITRVAVRMGANPLTLSGLSGMGDLVLTCTGELSRNRRVGLELGRGRTIQQIGDAGVAVADRDGLDGVSMKSVAAHLGMDLVGRPRVGVQAHRSSSIASAPAVTRREARLPNHCLSSPTVDAVSGMPIALSFAKTCSSM